MPETTENVSGENLSSKKDRILTFLRIFLSIIFVAFLILKNLKNFTQIYNSLINVQTAFLSLAVLIYFISLLAESIQWNIMLRAQKIKVSQLFLLQSMMIGFFYNNLLPSNIGGDFYRVLDISKNKKTSLEKNISAVFLERFFGLISIIAAIFIYFWVINKENGNPKMEEFSKEIQKGASTYLKRLFQALGGLALIVSIIIFFASGWKMSFAYLLGSSLSAFAGYF